MPATPAWLGGVEALLNRGLGASLQAAALARRLDGTALRLDVEGIIAIRLSVSGGRLALASDGRSSESGAAEPVAATISGSIPALLQLAGAGRRGAPGRAAPRAPWSATPPAAAQIRGDAEIANSYRQLLVFARPDWEEELSRVIGDLSARRVSRVARQAFAWVRAARGTAGENLAEYLQEESRDLVNKPELEEFLQGVDALRDTADRIAARIARLEHRLKGTT